MYRDQGSAQARRQPAARLPRRTELGAVGALREYRRRNQQSNANPALGTQPALGRVTLPQPAGTAGETVTLTSSNPAVAAVPATVGCSVQDYVAYNLQD
jgi:hypothetical protein